MSDEEEILFDDIYEVIDDHDHYEYDDDQELIFNNIIEVIIIHIVIIYTKEV